MMPPIDLTKSSPRWLHMLGKHGAWFYAPRAAVERARHNTTIGTDPTASFYGYSVDESDCNQILADMDRSAS